MAPLLEMRGITREFPGVRALDGASFTLEAGEVHALVGENGAGKSTLMNILGGVHPAGSYGGEVLVDGAKVSFRGPRESLAAGIAVIHQELALVKELSVTENLFLGREPGRHGVVDRDAAHVAAREALERVGLDISPEREVRHLGVGQQQLVEIAKALSRSARVLVLDEPTAALSENDATRLLGILRSLQAAGVACVYISHRLREVLAIASRVTVLRDGAVVWSGPAAGLSEDALVTKMVGRELEALFPPRTKAPGEVAFEVRGFSAEDAGSGRSVSGVGLSVRAGEVLGIGGLVGAGRTELLMALVGAWGRVTAGTVLVGGEPVRLRSPAEAIRAGVALAPEDRKRYGLVLLEDVARNVSLARLGGGRRAPSSVPSALPPLTRLGVVDRNEEVRRAEAAVRELGIRTPSVEQKTVNLSGGNQQKVVLAKWRETQPRVLLLDEPTRGVDVGAKVEIYALVRRLADEGAAVVLVSSELPELLGMSDRVLVMREGRVTGELPREAATEEAVMRLATGTGGGL